MESYSADDPRSNNGQIAGNYDKSRDVDGDGFPDYDSAGRKISEDISWTLAGQEKPDLTNAVAGDEFKIGHQTYRKNSNGQWDKINADGGVDNGNDNNGNTLSEFDEMIAETEDALVKTAMEGYIEEHMDLQGDELSAEVNKALADPEKWLKDSNINLTAKVNDLSISDETIAGASLDPDNPAYALDTDASADVTTISDQDISTVDALTAKNANTYKAETVTDDITGKEYQVDPITGEIEDKHLVDADDLLIDIEGSATGINADGTKNVIGEALNDYANQNISNIIDTSTVSGKLLAQELGEGNYLDSKATLLGQLDIISKQFVDANGNPKIPTWVKV